MSSYLGVDCGSISLNVSLSVDDGPPRTIYERTHGRPLPALHRGITRLIEECGDIRLAGALVTGSGRELLSRITGIPTINEITAHATGAYSVNPAIRTIIEIGGQDSKFMEIEPPSGGITPRIPVFRMNELCAAGTGAFLDEQAQRLGIAIESFGDLALSCEKPASIAGRCAVFAKTDMIHQAQEGATIPDILMGLAFSLVRNYVSTLIKGDLIKPLVSLQGGVMSNSAVVEAFTKVLGLGTDSYVIPPHFKELGAVGCMRLAQARSSVADLSLGRILDSLKKVSIIHSNVHHFKPLSASLPAGGLRPNPIRLGETTPPIIMGLDIGSVSVKGVVIDATGMILGEVYEFSHSKPLDTLTAVMGRLAEFSPDVFAITGSGRYLAGRLLDCELIVNEISAQGRSALEFDPTIDSVIEIGGQDSKWIGFENGAVTDFEMNRVCAAGTGSFLMAQSAKLDLDMETEFSAAALRAGAPVDLGSRCTVFMESDLVHHQNNGASREDLAAGICVSIVKNYIERTMSAKPVGRKALFLGGVAAAPAVKAAFEQFLGVKLAVPPWYKVSGAYGAALKALDALEAGNLTPKGDQRVVCDPSHIEKDHFSCAGCVNQCRITKYKTTSRTIFSGGLCDKWELEKSHETSPKKGDFFSLRERFMEELPPADVFEEVWGMARVPQVYEYYPFWHEFLKSLGVKLTLAPRSTRTLFLKGLKHLNVETCLPMKALAGHFHYLKEQGVKKIFNPAILNERIAPDVKSSYCPYIQASSRFFKGAFDFEWIEPIVNNYLMADSFKHEHIQLALTRGFSKKQAAEMYEAACEAQNAYDTRLESAGRDFLASLADDGRAVVILGKPYHSSDAFLNMNIGPILRKLGVKALPADLYPFDPGLAPRPVTWKYQSRLAMIAAEIAHDPRLFPVFITFYGCGPDAFTFRHLREAFGQKPFLTLEMDEHSSTAGMITRLEAFLDRMRSGDRKKRAKVTRLILTHNDRPQGGDSTPAFHIVPPGRAVQSGARTRKFKAETLFIPYISDHAFAFAAAAKSIDIDAHVLDPPNKDSEELGRSHLIGGECHPYALVLGDYLKVCRDLPDNVAQKSIFYVISPDACRLREFPIYLEKVRRELDLSLRVAPTFQEGIQAFGATERQAAKLIRRAWEGVNAFDALARVYLGIRPRAHERYLAEAMYIEARSKICDALIEGKIGQGLEEALHALGQVPVDESKTGPLISITGDYYTRVVPFANNDVYEEVEALGGFVWPPPTYSDCIKLATIRDFLWTASYGDTKTAAKWGLYYALMVMSEYKVRKASTWEFTSAGALDLMGFNIWKSADLHTNIKLPPGITAPIATTLLDINQGVDGILNLISLNCSYGTVVTAALNRIVKERNCAPMLTLVYDGLKKTNEKTRLEAFMEQAWEHYNTKGRQS